MLSRTRAVVCLLAGVLLLGGCGIGGYESKVLTGTVGSGRPTAFPLSPQRISALDSARTPEPFIAALGQPTSIAPAGASSPDREVWTWSDPNGRKFIVAFNVKDGTWAQSSLGAE